MEIGSWSSHRFEVGADIVRSFTDLQITAKCETDDKTTNGETYAARKNAGTTEVSVKIILNGLLGCEPRNEAEEFLEQARNGEKAYFYVGGRKLVPCQLMLTQAQVGTVQIGPGGQWVSAEVTLTMKQCSKWDGAMDAGKVTSPNVKKKEPVKQQKAADTAANKAKRTSLTERAAREAEKKIEEKKNQKVVFVGNPVNMVRE